MNINSYLLQHKEPCPSWLLNFKPGDAFNRQQFFGSRQVFYPGHGRDGHPVKLFGASHSAHCFVYADYYVERDALEDSLSNLDPRFHRRFRGHHTLARLNLSQTDLTPHGWRQHAVLSCPPNMGRDTSPFGFVEILERDDGLDDQHGAQRLAILFLGADGIATYDALFCQQNGALAPFAALIQDHGFAGNYDKFGEGGLLERMAMQCQVLPKFLLVARGSDVWRGYSQCLGVSGDVGGVQRKMRFLHKQWRDC